MCNLYSMTKAREAVLRLFRVGHNRATAFEPLRAIFPGHTAPIVRRAEDGERELVTLSWGFVLLRDGYAPMRVMTSCRHPSGDHPSRHAAASGRRPRSASRMTAGSLPAGIGSHSPAMSR